MGNTQFYQERRYAISQPDITEEADGLENVKVNHLFELDKESESKLNVIVSEAEKLFKDTPIMDLAAFNQPKIESKLHPKPKKRIVESVYYSEEARKKHQKQKTVQNISVPH